MAKDEWSNLGLDLDKSAQGQGDGKMGGDSDGIQKS